MSKKRRVKLSLDEDEAAVIAPLEFWDHLREIYFAYADDTSIAEEKASWHHAAELVAFWVAETKASYDHEDY